ncbi:putative ankyrin repeat protein RF_0381 [Saccostrea echinata]|uniref:putative ankyrin repeat protein RF_0381 n=1 Tax=Saccostrea echinata TaxID=191078 RepID=UPI002A8151C6|nr:putative ankyrin repeat protein RF_0381 [Saccostrea echinata]
MLNMSSSRSRKPPAYTVKNTRRYKTMTNRPANKVNVFPAKSNLAQPNILKKTVSLLTMEKDLNLDEYTDARMLFNAIRKGQIRLVKFILVAAPREVVNALDLKGKTPLMISCFLKEEMSRDMIVELLLQHGAEVNTVSESGRTALSYACEYRCNDIVDILVKHASVDPDIPDNDGNTPLIYCAKVGNDVGIDILTRHFRRLGLGVDHSNKMGFTAILMAAKECNIACVKILANQGHASLLHRDKTKNFSVNDWLAYHGYTKNEIMQILPSVRKARRKFIDAINIARMLPSIKWNKEKKTLLDRPPSMVSSITVPLTVTDFDIPPRKKKPVTRHRSLDGTSRERFLIKRLHSLQLPKIYRGMYDSPYYESEEDEGKRSHYRPHFEKCRQRTFEEYLSLNSSSDDD